ncbi:molybdopterin molybdotransferase MoeA [Halococcus thailandensis]|uniref:Molybdenum cofactor synthesis domain-containing protein n=1 Tax=Halococcus thailandensis JCM 13552 TaxID=1227457 RepID=M0MWH7_9EURY|nr:molybdopterin molybdotransferase MoeA [Halococcus thailandensis]EMA49668.1 molybdenum cofactor synthesis domain-containing protein [Halococcus thailandensis JCM 13552]
MARTDLARADAVEQLLDHRSRALDSLPGEPVSFDALAGRTLAEDVRAPTAVPPHDYATMDGFAIATDDESPAVVAEVFPEDEPPTLDEGEAARIATGAPLPIRTDAVLKVEDATVENEQVSGPQLAPGTNVSPRGGTARAGETLFEAGTRLAARHAALLRDVGIESVTVHERFSVGIVATGTEIHEGRQPDRDSDFLAGLIREWGHEPTIRESVPDDSGAVRRAIENAAATHDVVLTTGGTSVGSADHVATVLEAHDPLFESVRLQPGRPVLAAVVDDALVVGLPGKPLAAHTAAVLVARPFFTGQWRLPSVTAGLTSAVEIPDDEREYAVPVVLDGNEAIPLGHADSSLPIYDERFAPGLVSANTRTTTADGIVLAEHSLDAGQPVAVVPYRVLA